MVVERALRGAPPHGLLDSLRVNLARHYGATDVGLLLADYGLVTLRPFDRTAVGGPVSVESSPAGKAFSAQQPYLSTGPGLMVTVHLPVTVRGDRYGVLTVTLPEDGSPESVQDLEAISEMLGHALRVAERHTDVYRQARRERRLTAPAEMQWQLLPGRTCRRDEFDLHAYWEPVYASRGHLFDWSASADQLTLVVASGTGPGIEDALLNNLALNAIRNARRSRADLVGQASLADQALYGQHGGSRYLPTVLIGLELRTGTMRIVDAGSPTVWRMRGSQVERMELEGQLPLGMFEDTVYSTQQLQLLPGDRLLFVACVDGPSSSERDSAGAATPDDNVVSRAIEATRHLSCVAAPQAVYREIWTRGGGGAADGGSVLCLDWHGRPVRRTEGGYVTAG
ncbi:PP2C family protein-serine/threonine phosphatase [Streptomyces sp. NPDC057445]|uniref:PP2C family protein-serine/threonine phosphatase n=1 Tax=Streptomyces sp. NPDC057445 TaxID=3346136 RepID=UPI0036B3A5C0